MRRRHRAAPAKLREPTGTTPVISRSPGKMSETKSIRQHALTHLLQSLFSAFDLSFLYPALLPQIRKTIDAEPRRIAAIAPLIG
jgi:hypothetical protein